MNPSTTPGRTARNGDGGEPPGNMVRAEKRRPSRWHAPIWWLNGLAVISLALSYLSGHVSPAALWPLAFFGIAYPFLLAANVLCLLWWALFRRKRMWPSLLTILAGWGHVGEYVQLAGDREAPVDAATKVKVMSWNVRLFDLYNWTHSDQTREEILQSIRLEDADILCMQEFLNERKSLSPVREQLLHDHRFINCADEYTAHTKYGHDFGIATFSTYPIVAKGAIHFPDDLNNLCLWTDIAIDADTVRVYNGHLASIRFGDMDYRFMKEVVNGEGTDSIGSAGSRIMDRLKNAFIRRAQEVERITAHMHTSPYPVIWCGDLNDTPMSYSYHTLRSEGLEDAFVESGQGVGHTYIGAFPSFRIDHILHSDAIRVWDFRTQPEELSDHRAISTWITVRSENQEQRP